MCFLGIFLNTIKSLMLCKNIKWSAGNADTLVIICSWVNKYVKMSAFRSREYWRNLVSHWTDMKTNAKYCKFGWNKKMSPPLTKPCCWYIWMRRYVCIVCVPFFVQSSLLWSKYSMNKVLLIKNNMDLGRYHKLTEFLKNMSIGNEARSIWSNLLRSPLMRQIN